MTTPQNPVDYLTLQDLMEIADGIIGDFAVRDVGLLASAAARPAATAFGLDAYPSTAEKAAALMHSLARNHALVDGNKRLAWSAARVFLLMNGRDLVIAVDEAEDLVLSVARGELDGPALAKRLSTRMT